MAHWITIQKDDKHIAKEKTKAKKLKNSQWWKNKINQGKCHYCSKEVLPKKLTMDHVVPLSRGGKSSKGNVVPCCSECNNKKKYLTPVDLILLEGEKEKEGEGG